MRSLREWRAVKLMTIRDLASKANVANQTIVQIEHGRISPRLSTMRRISEALDVDAIDVEEFEQAIQRSGTSTDGDGDASENERADQEPATHRLQPLLDPMSESSQVEVPAFGIFGVILDQQGDVLYVSASHERVLGTDPGWEVGADIFDAIIQFIHPDDQYDSMRLVHYLLVTPGAVDEAPIRIRFSDGAWREMRLHGTNLLDHPAVEGVVLVASATSTNHRDAAAN